ncbi:MAG: hypothetical protein QOJ73_984 [Streptosporangiaceae bacterium]|nr:hypothetical protein [Streptosporangiaceae bacterium]
MQIPDGGVPPGALDCAVQVSAFAGQHRQFGLQGLLGSGDRQLMAPFRGGGAGAIAIALPLLKLGLAPDDLFEKDFPFPGQRAHLGPHLPFGVTETSLATLPRGAGALPVELALPVA